MEPRTIRITPAFFMDDNLAQCSPEARLIYQLMWSVRNDHDVVEREATHYALTVAAEHICEDTIAVIDCISELKAIGYLATRHADGGTVVRNPDNGFGPDFNPFTRRARILMASGRASAEAIAARVEYYGGLCWICRTKPYEAIDHVKPIRHGGSLWPANLRPACKSCNSRKGSKWPYRPEAITP